jgi:hypothetical protein
MAYSEFTLERVENELGVTLETSGNLFGSIVPPSHPQTSSFKSSIG